MKMITAKNAMKGLAVVLSASAMTFVAGCGDGGIEFNGQTGIQGLTKRQTPITHYNLPSETVNQTTQVATLDVSTILGITQAQFLEQSSPGHDLWGMAFGPRCTDNPTCSTPAPVPDWIYALDTQAPWGTTGWVSAPNGSPDIAAYCLSFQNQWMLRGITGGQLTAMNPGDPPVFYENLGFSSMAISIHDAGAASATSALLGNTPPSAKQQEIGPAGTFDANNVPRTQVPMNNLIEFQYNGSGAPAGLMAAGWSETPGENTHIETNMLTLSGVWVPDYFGGGSTITTGGGVYTQRFVGGWLGTTSGGNSNIAQDDAPIFAYYIAVVANHVIGKGVGLSDSAFALPGTVNNQESIMNISAFFDMTAFIASGKQFQFSSDELLVMQDVVAGDFMAPGPDSTLPGSDGR